VCRGPANEAMGGVQGAPRLKVAIVGSGLAGLSAAVELLDQVAFPVDPFASGVTCPG